jgi:thiol-disulfide isomerase/thioredoxin
MKVNWPWQLGLLALVLVGCSTIALAQSDSRKPQTTPVRADLRDFSPAPELENTVWLNTPGPLRLAHLRGSVVLLEMWTFDCINCQHVLPSVRGWYQRYSPQGLVVIGNHYPEFDYERSLDNLKKAIADQNVPFPVAQDNDGKTWKAYKNGYWPTIYLIDKRGEIRYEHIGEGGYEITEAAIQSLLAESYP